MCGIVGAIGQRDVVPILLDGLSRLEYRGYDSSGLAVINNHHQLHLQKSVGKVNALREKTVLSKSHGYIGIAHTRWATHGAPSLENAHPHIALERLTVVHNGIIENYQELKTQLIDKHQHHFYSQTDTEVVSVAIAYELQHHSDLLTAVREVTNKLQGAFALAIMDCHRPDQLIAVRCGSPLVIGIGIEEHFLASDPLALQKVTQDFIFLEEDIAKITATELNIFDFNGNPVARQVYNKPISFDANHKGRFRHFMQKEIFEQPRAVIETLGGRLGKEHVLEDSFGRGATKILDKAQHIQIVACGTSYYAGMIAKHWFEEYAGIACNVEVASEFRYRNRVVLDNTLLLTISQSGETADTLAAMRYSKNHDADKIIGTLTICNVAESTIVRESDLVFLTHAGPEVGVASTKAFTTQLVSLLLLTVRLSDKSLLPKEKRVQIINDLQQVPNLIDKFLALDDSIKSIAANFKEKRHTLFLGRGVLYPVALEGALKLKEISYIHAEAYPAGELKHGPLALIDEHMPVIILAPNDELLGKIKSNIMEIHARGGDILVIASEGVHIDSSPDIVTLEVPDTPRSIMPILYTVILQLLAYHVAELKGTDIDQPRHLAKSVTVE